MLRLKSIVPVKTCDPMLARGLGPDVGHAETIKRTNPDLIRATNVNEIEDKALARLERRRDVHAKRRAGGKRGQARVWRA